MQTERDINDLIPDDPLIAAAWVGSLQYALSQPDVFAEFRAQTGNTYSPGTSPIDKMIDDATGRGFAFLRAFAKWHNEMIWGEEDGKPLDAGCGDVGDLQ
jgi:hypothetical protein